LTPDPRFFFESSVHRKAMAHLLFGLEQSEERGTISLNSMERVAAAMGCKLVYALVPLDGKTLEEMGEARRWKKRTQAN